VSRPSRHIRVRTADGLSVHAIDYPHEGPGLPVLCLHGLTRNAKDFDVLARTLLAGRRVIAMDQRGRGESENDPDPSRYRMAQYLADTWRLLDELGLASAHVVGTSMGGLMGLALAAVRPGRIRALVLNDIGPEIPPPAVMRMREFVGVNVPVADWRDAAARAKAINGAFFPDYGDSDWEQFARRLFRERPDGVPELAYDLAIRGQIDELAATDLWRELDAIPNAPILVLHGETSDILLPSIATRMQQRHPRLQVVEVPGRGHVPFMDEPAAADAISEFFSRLD
jgi:pimeloyl-ACP methyl ester carboxylesterase